MDLVRTVSPLESIPTIWGSRRHHRKASGEDLSYYSLLQQCGQIRKSINSVLQQSHRDIEYIVIDGGSTDGTTKIIEKFGDRISKILSEPDSGIYDAMNVRAARFTNVSANSIIILEARGITTG